MMNKRPTKKSDVVRGPFKNLRKSAARLTSGKGFLFVSSLLIAVFAWGALVASDSTLVREKTFSGVNVGVTGEAGLKSRGLIVMDDIKALVPGVRMTVEVAQGNYNRVSSASYNPHFDLAQIKGTGENELKINFSSTLYGPVVDCEPSSVTVNVEQYMTRRVPVVVETIGKMPEGLYLDSVRTDPTMLSVSGPRSLVMSVSRASAQLNLASLSAERMSDRTALAVQLQTASGEAVISDKLEITNQTIITDSIVADTELVPAKMVPVDLTAAVTGEPAQGYELTAVTLEKPELLIAAKQEVLDAMEIVTVDEPLDISGASGPVSGYIRIRRPSGTENTVPLEIGVVAEIAEKTVERTLRGIAVDVEGVGAGLEAGCSVESMTVQLTGAYSFIEGLKKEDVRLFVDAAGLEAGEHTLPVQIRIDNAETFSCALSDPEIVLRLEPSQAEEN